jgi:hypothetical protein
MKTAVSSPLNKAYARIEAGDLHAALDLLEGSIDNDPLNIEAWEAYMQICETCNDLDYLCERMLQVEEMKRADRESILDYYYFLRQRMKSTDVLEGSQKMIKFELVDQFTYSLRENPLAVSGGRKTLDLEKGIARFLGMAIFIPYVVLFAIGLNLLFSGRNFSYWIMMAAALSIFVALWKFVMHLIDTNRNSSNRL